MKGNSRQLSLKNEMLSSFEEKKFLNEKNCQMGLVSKKFMKPLLIELRNIVINY
jgi:hypothetical protein